MSIFSRAEQLFKGTELLSEIPADLDAVSVAQRINELTIQRLSDGGYMFRVANADNSPCAVVSRDGSSIQLYADAARKTFAKYKKCSGVYAALYANVTSIERLTVAG